MVGGPVSAVFLSAGIPDQPERGDYVDTADPVAIRDAVRALTSVVLERSWCLVFGGHPAITPLVWHVASAAQRTSLVVIYQSEEYRGMIPEEAFGFENFVWRPDLASMRDAMVGARGYATGVFIGGMDGIEEEYALFGERQPHARRLAVGSTGGAAVRLWEAREGEDPSDVHHRLGHDLSYRSLFRDVLG